VHPALPERKLRVTQRPVASGVFTEGSDPRLIGGRDRRTGRILFPKPPEDERFEELLLPHRGTLWSYTVQRFRPKSPPYAGPIPFEPFAVGYVALAEAVIAESRLTDVVFEQLRIGMPMELTIIPLRTDSDGTVVTTFAFRPPNGMSA
jgi:hypothetical protein